MAAHSIQDEDRNHTVYKMETETKLQTRSAIKSRLWSETVFSQNYTLYNEITVQHNSEQCIQKFTFIHIYII